MTRAHNKISKTNSKNNQIQNIINIKIYKLI